MRNAFGRKINREEREGRQDASRCRAQRTRRASAAAHATIGLCRRRNPAPQVGGSASPGGSAVGLGRTVVNAAPRRPGVGGRGDTRKRAVQTGRSRRGRSRARSRRGVARRPRTRRPRERVLQFHKRRRLDRLKLDASVGRGAGTDGSMSRKTACCVLAVSCGGRRRGLTEALAPAETSAGRTAQWNAGCRNPQRSRTSIEQALQRNVRIPGAAVGGPVEGNKGRHAGHQGTDLD